MATSNPTPASSEQKPTSIGPIVGGVVGGLTVICLTVLGVSLIRRKRGATEYHGVAGHHGVPEQMMQQHPPTYDFANDAELSTHNSRYVPKGYHWDSSHGPVEMHGGYRVNTEPVELQGKTPML
jgi:hypothetical protein